MRGDRGGFNDRGGRGGYNNSFGDDRRGGYQNDMKRPRPGGDIDCELESLIPKDGNTTGDQNNMSSMENKRMKRGQGPPQFGNPMGQDRNSFGAGRGKPM